MRSIKILSWNVRGLGRAEKMRNVSKVLVENSLNVVLLQETKLKEVSWGVKRRLCVSNLDGIEVAPSKGAIGGLVSIWDKKVFICEKSIVQDRLIILVGAIQAVGLKCGIINLYTPNDQAERERFFEYVTGLIASLEIPIVMGGDFNTIKEKEEKQGAEPSERAMQVFKYFIQQNDLIDLPLKGGAYTWFRGGSSPTACRLDRFLVSTEVLMLFSDLTQMVLPRGLSDHNPI
ncbi:hypothetical protein HRI_000547200 [Hibiscus trionum]|uniref:Endonuclease/exonuclease/phosphatase domain-containing protein n=1 Tax=Hibiscus trionum TaxID=183268 RepID=A0A9W7LLI5_HIBTR|nr:hypothetical protein HRI_000547200 [Hibiscus trionum]